MKRGLILLLTLMTFLPKVLSYELILPKDKKSSVSTNYAFFVGKARNSEVMSINDEKVYIAPNGAFAHSIKLKDGENRIVVRSNYNTQIYKVYKNKPVINQQEAICDFDIKPAIVKNDNTPLRKTPVDAGMNRISHLFKDTNILINGSKGNFYRVYLSKDTAAWIAKKDVIVNCKNESEPAKFINIGNTKFKNAAIQTISFSKNLPYTIEERDDEILFKVYNPEVSDSSVYTLNIQKPKKYAYNITLQDGQYTFKVTEPPQSIEDCTIVVDAGHGGYEKGAIGCLGDEEKNINLKIALELQEQLKKLGANVVMTRECDGYISLEDRVKLAKDCNAHIFVSIHLNSIPDIKMDIHKNKGTSVYYYNPNSKALASTVLKSVNKIAGTRNDGIRTASFAVIRPVNYAAILVESAYMTNPNDSVLYTSDSFAQNIAQGIKEGIVEYLNK